MSDLPKPDRPLVSVIVPAYNAELFIEKTLKSVLNQTYTDIEVLVVDDGSCDRTVEVVEQIAGSDRRVRLFRQPNSGVAAARNAAIRQAKGELIAPIDADDIWYPSNLEKQVCCLLNSPPAVGLVYSWSADITENDQLTGSLHAASIKGDVYTTLLCHNFLGNASATLIRKTCLDRVGGYSSRFKQQQAQGCEDWDLYLRIAERYEFRVVPEFLVGYRKIQHSMSRDYSSMAKSQALMLQAVQQKHPKIPSVFYRLSCSSFYLYLAHQSSQTGEDRSALSWLWQALQIECITPFLRFGFYVLAIKSLVRLLILKTVSAPVSRVMPLPKARSAAMPTVETVDLTRQKLSLSFKVWVGAMFHHIMLLINQRLSFESRFKKETPVAQPDSKLVESPLKPSHRF